MDRQTAMRVAAQAECDVRTVIAMADGKRIRPLLRERIERAMRALRIKRQ